MTRYAGLLRGVNVGGVTVKMADLAEEVRGLGYGEVRTVLASGNVLFETDDDEHHAKGALEQALRRRFGYEAWVHVLPIERLRRIVDGYPFERGRDGWHDYVSFTLDDDVRAALLAVDLDPAVERAQGGDGVVYWTVVKGSTIESAMGKAQGAARYKPHLTTRNVNTLDRLLA